MPKAVDSNSTNVSEIHPVTLIEECFNDLSNSLQAFRIAIKGLLESDGIFRTTPDIISTALDEIIEQFKHQRKQIRILLKPLAASLPHKPDIKAVRDRFILELIEQGFSNEQISQALNLRLSAIDKIITQMEDKTGTTGTVA